MGDENYGRGFQPLVSPGVGSLLDNSASQHSNADFD